MDFGFGRPERVRSGGNKLDGMVYLYLGCGGEGRIDVELALQPEPMQGLEKDAELIYCIDRSISYEQPVVYYISIRCCLLCHSNHQSILLLYLVICIPLESIFKKGAVCD